MKVTRCSLEPQEARRKVLVRVKSLPGMAKPKPRVLPNKKSAGSAFAAKQRMVEDLQKGKSKPTWVVEEYEEDTAQTMLKESELELEKTEIETQKIEEEIRRLEQELEGEEDSDEEEESEEEEEEGGEVPHDEGIHV